MILICVTQYDTDLRYTISVDELEIALGHWRIAWFSMYLQVHVLFMIQVSLRVLGA